MVAPIPVRWFRLNDSFYRHVEALYEGMSDEIGDKREIRGVRRPVYVGFMGQTVSNASIPLSYYSSVLAVLKEMGCIAQLRRGARHMQSEWVLLGKPTKKAFRHVAELLQPEAAAR